MKYFKIGGFFCVLLLLSYGLKAQQIFTISQFNQHNFIYNPAAAGANDRASVGITHRSMWASMPGGPQTSIIFGDKYYEKNKVGVAMMLYDDKTGPTSRSGGELSASYSLVLNKDRRLMFGLGAQVLQYKINKEALAEFIPNDPLLASSGTTIKGDASAGVYYKSSTFNFGVSVKQLVQSKFNFIKTNSNPEGKLYRHYYLIGSYNLKTDDDNLLIPNIIVQYLPNAPVDYSAGLRLEHKELFWVGFSHHFNQGFSAQTGLTIQKQISIGYAYDRYKTPLNLFDDGSGAHEISLRYFFKKK